ncbi:MAG: 30S ribosomal protein S6 [Desulfurispora sp.]|uniref:30S ribosomal protein S6 n=1 Tax=Desulfurispora sp. TaxID=3014275 RepID=UPI00404B0A8D
MRKYEVVFILHPELDEEKASEVVEKFKALIAANGGEVTQVDKWGKRRLAYEIKHLREGLYYVLKFSAGPQLAKELDRVMKITDEIVRHIIVREDE